MVLATCFEDSYTNHCIVYFFSCELILLADIQRACKNINRDRQSQDYSSMMNVSVIAKRTVATN